MTRSTTTFSHTMRTPGLFEGRTLTGIHNLTNRTVTDSAVPLIVAIHGGGYHSAYFDLPGYSLLERAAAVGVPVIAVDRPNYGHADGLQVDGSILEANAHILDDLVGELWETHGEGTSGVFLIGHSIGAALALLIASHSPAWPLLGVAVSGRSRREPPSGGLPWGWSGSRATGTCASSSCSDPRAATATTCRLPKLRSTARHLSWCRN
jgi:pimeloyl-ACP methyl ester carboxylesterase